MSENTTPADETKNTPVSNSVDNKDNASASNSKPEAQANQTESTSQPAKKEPIQGVRDTRANKGEDSPEGGNSSQPDKSGSAESRKKPTKATKQDQNSSDNDANNGNQNKSGNQSQNANRRGRRGRKTTDQPVAKNAKRRVSVDPSKVAKKAWKIFLAEVGEEGLALIGDKEGKDLTKRSFKLAELFQEEVAFRIAQAKQDKKSDKQERKQTRAPIKRAKNDSADSKPAVDSKDTDSTPAPAKVKVKTPRPAKKAAQKEAVEESKLEASTDSVVVEPVKTDKIEYVKPDTAKTASPEEGA